MRLVNAAFEVRRKDHALRAGGIQSERFFGFGIDSLPVPVKHKPCGPGRCRRASEMRALHLRHWRRTSPMHRALLGTRVLYFAMTWAEVM